MMSGKQFKLPPLSPLIGTDLINYLRVTSKGKIQPGYWVKYILTGLIILILTPFRWYERWQFRHVSKISIKTPIFILGHWRSGTTHLHNLLCQSPDAAFITTYQTVFTQYLASKGLLKPVMNVIMPHKRPSDNVELNVEYPQEEEFALSNSTTASYYHFFYFPQHVDRYFDRYVRFQEKDIGTWKKAYDKLLKKAAALMPAKKYLVVKNPVNTARVNVLRSLYPDAKFIHIYRNPFIVFLSTKKFFLELMPTLWLHKISEEEIEQLILDKYCAFMDLYYSPEIDRQDIVDIRFESFEKNPLEGLEKIYDTLGIPDFDKVKPDFIKYISRKKGYRKNEYSISRREVQLVRQAWGKYLERWNYELPDNMRVVD